MVIQLIDRFSARRSAASTKMDIRIRNSWTRGCSSRSCQSEPSKPWKFWWEQRALCRALRYIYSTGLLLELPCGNGCRCPLLVAFGYQVVGVDSSEVVNSSVSKTAGEPNQREGSCRCDGAKHGRGNYLEVACSQPQDLPFKDDCFDGVVCIGLLEVINSTNRIEVLKELRRVSRSFVVVSARPAVPSVQYFQLHGGFPRSPESMPPGAFPEIEEAGMEICNRFSLSPLQPFRQGGRALLVLTKR